MERSELENVYEYEQNIQLSRSFSLVIVKVVIAKTIFFSLLR